MTSHQFALPKIAILLLIFVSMVGCGTVSPNTVQLSVELTNRIKDIEASHRGFVNAYFDGEIQRIDTFMAEKWTPLFLRNFLGTSNILNELGTTAAINDGTRKELVEVAKIYLEDSGEADRMANELATELNTSRNGDAQIIDKVVQKYVQNSRMVAATTHFVSLLQVDTPAKMIMDFAEAANEEIRDRRDSLVVPIEQARKRALDDIAVAYQDLYAGQGMITGRLEAAAKRGAQEAKIVDTVAGQGTAAELMGRLNQFALEFNGAFQKMDRVYEKYNVDKSAKDGGAGQLIDSFKADVEKALTKYKLK